MAEHGSPALGGDESVPHPGSASTAPEQCSFLHEHCASAGPRHADAEDGPWGGGAGEPASAPGR